MNPDFQMPGLRTPSAEHQERGRCWKHICQPAPMLSGTPLPPPPALHASWSLCTHPGRRLYSLGLHLGTSLEAAAAEGGLLPSGMITLSTAASLSPVLWQSLLLQNRKWGADPSSALLSLTAPRLQSSKFLCQMANLLPPPFSLPQHTS